MKATGIVRRVDDLGRIVIPKELRRTYHIRENDPMEFYVEAGSIIVKKYSAMSTIFVDADVCAKALQRNFGATVLVCGTDAVIAASRDMAGTCNKLLSDELVLKIRNQKEYTHIAGDSPLLPFAKSEESRYVQMLVPVLNEKELFGAVVILNSDADTAFQDTMLRGARMAAMLLADHLGG